uniref:Uncharacterized protein n=1 Tax=Oryza brachyantha TaxID=4533 RepID=J3MJJ1_ORYBR
PLTKQSRRVDCVALYKKPNQTRPDQGFESILTRFFSTNFLRIDRLQMPKHKCHGLPLHEMRWFHQVVYYRTLK